ncbi:MAG: hypothetical protein NT117_10395 [Gammaproteobacteria bacterium]|nr:hypothetical protein [Gammaproteobacteria bacterium]
MPKLTMPTLSPEDQTPAQIGIETFAERHLDKQREKPREGEGPAPPLERQLAPELPQLSPQERMQAHHGIVREAIQFYRDETGQQRLHSHQRDESGVPTANQQASQLEQTRFKNIDDQLRFMEVLMNGQTKISHDNVEQHRKIFNSINERLDDVMQLYGAPPRPDMERIRNVDDLRPRMPHQTLGMGQDGLYRLAEPDGHGEPKVANGGYVFVVPVTNPSEIWIGARANGGHTAISRGADVYFAGEIEFDQGRLVRWDNNSGHYRPEARLHNQLGNSAIGTLETLLPRDRFEPKHI